jgi:hypothetical protein
MPLQASSNFIASSVTMSRRTWAFLREAEASAEMAVRHCKSSVAAAVSSRELAGKANYSAEVAIKSAAQADRRAEAAEVDALTSRHYAKAAIVASNRVRKDLMIQMRSGGSTGSTDTGPLSDLLYDHVTEEEDIQAGDELAYRMTHPPSYEEMERRCMMALPPVTVSVTEPEHEAETETETAERLTATATAPGAEIEIAVTATATAPSTHMRATRKKPLPRPRNASAQEVIGKFEVKRWRRYSGPMLQF